jgi:hypothetical protein
MNGLVGRWMDEWMNYWMVGWIDLWMNDGLMNRWMHG